MWFGWHYTFYQHTYITTYSIHLCMEEKLVIVPRSMHTMVVVFIPGNRSFYHQTVVQLNHRCAIVALNIHFYTVQTMLFEFSISIYNWSLVLWLLLRCVCVCSSIEKFGACSNYIGNAIDRYEIADVWPIIFVRNIVLIKFCDSMDWLGFFQSNRLKCYFDHKNSW